MLGTALFALAAFAFGVYNLCDAFGGPFTRYSAMFPINIFGGIAGVQAGLYFGLPLVLP